MEGAGAAGLERAASSGLPGTTATAGGGAPGQPAAAGASHESPMGIPSSGPPGSSMAQGSTPVFGFSGAFGAALPNVNNPPSVFGPGIGQPSLAFGSPTPSAPTSPPTFGGPAGGSSQPAQPLFGGSQPSPSFAGVAHRACIGVLADWGSNMCWSQLPFPLRLSAALSFLSISGNCC